MEERPQIDFSSANNLAMETKEWLETRFRDVSSSGVYEMTLLQLLDEVDKDELADLLSEACLLLHKQNDSLVKLLSEINWLRGAIVDSQGAVIKLQDALIKSSQNQNNKHGTLRTGGPIQEAKDGSAFAPAITVTSNGKDNEETSSNNLEVNDVRRVSSLSEVKV